MSCDVLPHPPFACFLAVLSISPVMVSEMPGPFVAIFRANSKQRNLLRLSQSAGTGYPFWKARLCLCLCNPTSTYPLTPPTARGRASEKTLQSARGKKGANCKSQREGSRQKKNARSKSNRARRNKRAKENESEPTDSKPASFKSKREGRKHKASPGARERRQESSKTKVRYFACGEGAVSEAPAGKSAAKVLGGSESNDRQWHKAAVEEAFGVVRAPSRRPAKSSKRRACF